MRPLVLALGLELVMACTGSSHPMQDVEPKPGPLEPHRSPIVADSQEPTVPAVPAVHYVFISRRRDKPPASTLFFDVSLRNPGDRARWFLLRNSVAMGKHRMATSAFGVGVMSFPGTGNVVVAKFTGTGGFYALQLPPGAEVELRALEIGMASDLPDPLPLEFIVADGFTVGGQPPEAWTKTPARSDAVADATQKGAKAVSDYNPPDLKSVPVEIQGGERFTELVKISPP